MTLSVARRTFEATRYPVGSPERQAANLNALTSEYCPGSRYALVCRSEDGSIVWTEIHRTKAGAKLALQSAAS